MKAFVRIDSENQDLKLIDVPVPEIKEDEILIKVEAFGVGIHDRYYIPSNVEFPYVIGSEGAGVVEKLGNQVKDFSIGDRVFFTTVLQAQGGCWAEYTAANQASVTLLPKNVTFEQGAAISMAGKTALECVRDLNLQKGDMLFIAGASGAIGTYVIQLASRLGVKIAASASSENLAYLESIGANKAVDYNDKNWKDKVITWSNGGVKAALAIQPGTERSSIEVVKDIGKVIMVSGYGKVIKSDRSITVKQLEHRLDEQSEMKKLADLISKGKIKVIIENEYSFGQAVEALEKTETRHARGKVIVKGFR